MIGSPFPWFARDGGGPRPSEDDDKSNASGTDLMGGTQSTAGYESSQQMACLLYAWFLFCLQMTRL